MSSVNGGNPIELRSSSIQYHRCMARIFTRHALRPINTLSSFLLPRSQFFHPSPFCTASSSLHHPQSKSALFPDRILESLLKCRTVGQFSQIHALLTTSGHSSNPFYTTKLLKLSSEMKDLSYTLAIYRNVVSLNRVCVNLVISAYAASSVALQGVVFYFRMLKVGLIVNSYTFPPLLSCCANSGCALSGQKCHGQVVKRGFEFVLEIQNSLIHMYGCFGFLDMSSNVFDEMPERDLVSWHSLIGACCTVGDMPHAHKLFDVMPLKKNVISWNLLMTGYLEHNRPGLVFKLFEQMQKASFFIGNSRTLVSVLTASGRLERLREGTSVHGFLLRRNWESNLILDTALIDMYCKCKQLEPAQWIFDRLSEKNLVCWNAMILGHCLNGNPQSGLELFSEMLEKEKFNPDAITFVGVLCACNRASLLEKGREYFQQMVKKFCVKPNFAHYWCMANLLASNDLEQEALEMVRKVNEFHGDLASESVIWASLLGLSRFQGNVKSGERVAKSLIQFEPQNIMSYALLFNVYAAGGKWDDAFALKGTIRKAFAGREVGSSLVDMIEIVHEFALDKSSKEGLGVSVSVDGLFQRRDLVCSLLSKFDTQRYNVLNLASEG